MPTYSRTVATKFAMFSKPFRREFDAGKHVFVHSRSSLMERLQEL